MIIKTSYPFMKPPPSARLIRGHRLAQGLVFFPLFNEGGESKQVFDLSENGNTVTLEGNPQWIAGKYGSAIDFDGNDYGSVGDKPSLDFGTGDFSIVFSARKTTVADTTGYAIIGKQDTGSGWYIYFYRESAREAAVTFWHRASATIISSNNLIDYGIADGTWHDYAFVRSEGIGYIFIDNIEVAYDNRGDISADVNSSGDNCEIGRRMVGGTDDRYFDDELGLISLYNRALSASERAELIYRPFCMLERRARTALMSGYEVVAPPTGIAVLRRRIEAA